MHDCGILLLDDTAYRNSQLLNERSKMKLRRHANMMCESNAHKILFLMDNQPTIDRGILLPILLGGFSIIGIIVVLLIGRSLNSPPPVSASPSATAIPVYLSGDGTSDLRHPSPKNLEFLSN